MIKIDDYPLVKVTWTDAKDGIGGWEDVQEIMKYDLAIVQDVGWMISKNPQKIVIMGSFCLSDEDPQEGGRYTAIPTKWIQKVEYLEVKETKIISGGR
jgi:hypothetical protein|tara:strand:+ start:5468 stop:5761 length:294 start_codon:yes stop_codon:yes gene_type:complete